MSAALDRHVAATHAALQERLRRHNLVFVQHGAVFEPLTKAVLASLREEQTVDVRDASLEVDARQVHITGLERFAKEQTDKPTLGQLRQTVSTLLGRDVEVCLWSRAPRVAFAPVPGSSLIDDASPFFLELLPIAGDDPESVYPAIEDGATLKDIYSAALDELGVAVLASLDRAIYDGQLGRDALFEMLDAREVEALRGAGLARCWDGEPYQLAAPLRFSELRDQLAVALAAQLEPQTELSEIAADLWTIERTIRLALRTTAVEKFGPKWRGDVLHGDLNQKVIERAMVDGFVSARSIREIRDPIEWLSLGELIEVVTSAKFSGLELLPIFWSKFSQDVLPIRNRLSHMRHFKHGDRGIVRMWVSQVTRMLG